MNLRHMRPYPKPYASKFMIDSNGTKRREYLSIGPMVDVSSKYFRWFMRKLTKHTTLYTEMLSESSVVYALKRRNRLL